MKIDSNLHLRAAYWALSALLVYLNAAFAYHFGIVGKVPTITLTAGFSPPWWAYTGLGISSLLVILHLIAGIRWKTIPPKSLIVVAILQFFFLWLYAYREFLMPVTYFILTIGLAVVMQKLGKYAHNSAKNA